MPGWHRRLPITIVGALALAAGPTAPAFAAPPSGHNIGAGGTYTTYDRLVTGSIPVAPLTVYCPTPA